MTQTLQDDVRDALYNFTGLIKHEGLAGLVFGASLIFTDHLFLIARKVFK